MLMMYMTLIDDENDKEKFEEIYHTYSRLMRYRANQILKDEHLAEDAVQQAFLKIISHLNKINEIKCNKTKHFMVVVVERVAINIYNKEHRAHIISFEEMEETAEFEDKEEVTSQAGLNDIEAIIDQLPAKYRELFILKYCCGYSNHEISRILDIKEGTIRQRLARGKLLFSERLKEAGLYGE